MKKYLKTLSLAGAVLLVSVLASTVLAQTTTPPPSTAPAAKERHPAIRAAIRALERAKEELKSADHDFGGHREQALRDCDKAIEQLKLALQYDRK